MSLLALGILSGIAAYEVLDYIGSKQIKRAAEKVKADEEARKSLKETYENDIVIGPTLCGRDLPRGIFSIMANRNLQEILQEVK